MKWLHVLMFYSNGTFCGFQLIQTTNDIIFTLPLGAHMGMSLSPTIGIAKNCFDDEDWVSVALYMKEWSKCRKGCWKEK